MTKHRVDWVDPTTGARTRTTLLHVARFAHHINESHPVPADLQGQIGGSFYNEPPEQPILQFGSE